MAIKMKQQVLKLNHRKIWRYVGMMLTAIIVILPFISYSAEAVSEKRDVGKFHSVEFRGHGVVYIAPGYDYEVRLEGEEALLKDYETVVDSGILIIKSDSWLKFWRKKPITVYVSMPHFRRLSVAGSGSIVGESTIYSDSLTLELTGSGEIELDVETKQLGSNISGSGEIRLRGSTKVFQHTISGSGDLKALNLETERSDIKITGSGNCELSASNRLDVLISGSGTVFYRGDPRTVRQEVSGSGKVKIIE
jgi:hypothetical protein